MKSKFSCISANQVDGVAEYGGINHPFLSGFASEASGADMSLTELDFAKLLSNYPTHFNLPPHLALALEDLKKASPGSTSCCMQVCEALNKSGVKIPKEKFRTNREPSEFPKGSGFYYLLAVDEMFNYFKKYHGDPTILRDVPVASAGDFSQISKRIRRLEGIVLFRDNGVGAHIELWNKTNVVQDRGPSIMNASWMWSQPHIYFWQVGKTRSMEDIPFFVAQQLKGWWKVSDNLNYYYWFDLKNLTVVYTMNEPKNASTVPPKWPVNTGDVTFVDNKLEIDWDPAGFGATRETFTLSAPDGYKSMTGESNRFERLNATKMFQ